MKTTVPTSWEDRVVPPEEVLKRLEPGMSIFISTGVAEPRTMVKHLMSSDAPNLADLELMQVVSLGEAISIQGLRSQKFRLKTFFSGWVASDAITEGLVDLIPSRFSRIPHLIESRQIPIDAAIVQVTPPNEAGYCSLGAAVDVARPAMEQASLRIGEINSQIPVTLGDTFVPVSDFDLLVRSTEPPFHFPRWPVDEVFDELAANVASLIEDGTCLGYSLGPLFEALSRHLARKKHLGVHSPFFTDPLMEEEPEVRRHFAGTQGRSVGNDRPSLRTGECGGRPWRGHGFSERRGALGRRPNDLCPAEPQPQGLAERAPVH